MYNPTAYWVYYFKMKDINLFSIKSELGNISYKVLSDKNNQLLEPLSKIGVKFINIKEDITADLEPNLIISQDKTKNFQELANSSKIYNCPFISFNDNIINPNLFSPKQIQEFKLIRGHVTVVSQPDLVNYWECGKTDFIIEYGINIKDIEFAKSRFAMISLTIPIIEMAMGHIPIVRSTEYSRTIIKNGENGYLFNSDKDLDMIKKILNELPEKEKYIIGNEARKTIEKLFPLEKMLDKWNSVIKNTIFNWSFN